MQSISSPPCGTSLLHPHNPELSEILDGLPGQITVAYTVPRSDSPVFKVNKALQINIDSSQNRSVVQIACKGIPLVEMSYDHLDPSAGPRTAYHVSVFAQTSTQRDAIVTGLDGLLRRLDQHLFAAKAAKKEKLENAITCFKTLVLR